ncbi:8520_t:CDS:2, partial [Scutellospora calospora]
QQIIQYKTKTKLFNNELAWKSINQIDSITSELTKLACKILLIPTSSAAAERNWSNFSFIYNKK